MGELAATKKKKTCDNWKRDFKDLNWHKIDNQEEGGGSQGELEGAIPTTTTKKKKSGEGIIMMKGATTTNQPSHLSLLLYCQVLMGKVMPIYI